MAVLQVMKKSHVNPDPVKDARGSWKRGMILAVHEDEDCPEPPSPNSRTVFIRIPGVTKAQVKKYAKRKRATADPNAEVVGRRRYRLEWSTLPNVVKQALINDHEYTVTNIAKAKEYIRDTFTGQMEG